MMGRIRLKPKNDFLFKRLFGEAEAKDLLIDLLNSILLTSSKRRIVDVTIFENKDLTGKLIDDKTS